MKQPPPPRAEDNTQRAPDQDGKPQAVPPAQRPEAVPRQKGGAVDRSAAAAQVPDDDASLAPESGDKLGGGPGGR